MSNILVTTTDTGAIIVLTGASAIVGTGHVIADETVAVPNEPIIDFQGAGVTVTDDPGVKTIVTIPGGGHTIADEGVNLPAELILNFVGAGVTVTDNAGVSTIVTIPGGMAGTDIYFKVSAADTTESYGNTKLTVTAPLVKAIGTPGGNETLNFSIPVATAIADGYLSAANFISFLAGYNDKINSVTFSTATGIITFTQQDGGTLTVDIDGRFLQLDQTASQTIINGQPIQDTLTASELVATDGSKKLQSLAVATYPSLVELSYVKGVTSGIQVQINGKQAGHVNLTSLAALAFGATSFVKMTAAGTFALDTNTYSTTSHNHSGTYAPVSHAHAGSDITSGTIDGDRLPAMSTTKAGAVPATGTPSGKYLKDDGTWATVSGSGTPAGSTTEIQYNASGSFGASSNFKYDSDGSGNYLYLDGAKIYGDYATTNYLYSSRNVWLPQLHLGSSAAVAYLSTIVTGSSKTNVKIFSEENTVFSTAIKLPNSTPGTLAEGQLYFDGTHLYFRIGSTSYQIDQQSAGSIHNLLSATHGDTLADNVVRGDILIGNATPKWARLAKGAEGTFIRYNATDLTISTLTIPNTLVQYSVLASNTADILSAVTLAQQTLLGRLTGGAVAAITIGIADDNILQVDDATAADNDYAKFTSNGIEGVPYATVLSDIAALPLAGGTMSGDIQLGETDIKLDAVLSGDEKWSGIVITGTAGSAMTSGEVIFLASDGKWDKVDGILDGTDTGFSKQLGITLTTGNDTDAIEILVYGKVRSAKFPALTVGSPVYLSDTAGELVVAQPSTDNFCIRVVGLAITAEDLFFNPSNDYIIYKT